MPRGDWNDDSWYDDGEFPPASRQEGRGAMVAAAVFSFIMAGFSALIASTFLCCFGFWALVNVENQNQGVLPAEMVAIRMWFSLGVGIASAVSFLLQLIAGFGLPRGRPWSRTITLWLAGYSLFFAAALAGMSGYALYLNGDNEEWQVWSVIMIGIAVLHATYGILELSLLLPSRVARRYR